MYFIWTLDKVIKEAKKINLARANVSISFLPVQTKKREDVVKNTKTYLKILDSIKSQGLKSDVTIKLHQFGVYKYQDFMMENVEEVVSYADKLGIFVWVDMERMETVDITIELFHKLRQNHKNVGICLQTCLRRTEADMKSLLRDRVPMRLVKGGFYSEYDIRDWREVTENFSTLMEYLFENSDYPCIATHDVELVNKAKKIIKDKNIQNAEFQFFYGVSDKLAKSLVDQGFRVTIYIPYGNMIAYLWTGFHTFLNFRNIQRLLGLKKII